MLVTIRAKLHPHLIIIKENSKILIIWNSRVNNMEILLFKLNQIIGLPIR